MDRIDLLTASGLVTAPPRKVRFLEDLVSGSPWTPAGALFQVAAGGGSGLRPKDLAIDPRELRGTAIEAVKRETAQRRGFVRDVIRFGATWAAAAVGAAGLAASLTGESQFDRGAWEASLAALATLPAGRYAHLVPKVVVAAALAGPDSPSRSAAQRWLAFHPNDAVSKAGQRFLATGVLDDVLIDALAELDVIPLDSARQIKAIAKGGLVDRSRLGWMSIPRLTASEIDDLIDVKLLTREELPKLAAAFPTLKQYLTARLAPELLSDDAVRSVGFASEAARRTASAPNGRLDHAVSAFLGGDDASAGVLAEVYSTAQVDELRTARATVEQFAPELPPEGELSRPLVAFVARKYLALGKLNLPVATRTSGPATSALVSSAALQAAVDALYSAEWDEALQHSRSVLMHSNDERVRDEALNTMACALWQQGRDTQALDALATATAGSYTVNLVANAAIVARDIDPVVAANHLATLINEAPTTEFKVQAANIAIALWLADDEGSFAELAHAEDALPDVIARPLHKLLVSDINREDFISLLQIVRRHDSDWLTTPGALSRSPHARSLAARYHTAFAEDPSKALTVMSGALKAGQGEPWLLEERDHFMDMLIGAMLSSEPVPVAGVIALEVIDSQMPLDEDRRIPLAALAVRELALHAGQDDDSPGRLISSRLDLMVWAVAGVGRMSAAKRDGGRALVSDCARAVQWSTLRAVAHELDQMRGLLLMPAYQRRHAMVELRPMLLAARRDVLKLHPHVDQKTREATSDIVSGIDRLLSL